MSINQTRSIFFSPTHSTEQVITAIAQGVNLPVINTNLTLPEGRKKPVALTPEELLIIGFPVYGGRLPQIQERIFSLLPEGDNPVVALVVYGNRAYEDALLELSKLCLQKGYTLTAAAAFIGEHSYAPELGHNRPNPVDHTLAVQFGETILNNLRAGKTLPLENIPGAYPFKSPPPHLPVVPTTSNECTHCLLCVKACPMQAIAENDPAVINKSQCILCTACVKICPVQAKQILFPPLQEKMNTIIEANRAPKKPELFLP